MRYLLWLWRNMYGVRLNTAVRIVVGAGQVGFALLMVWLCRQFIDSTIYSPAMRPIIQMVAVLIAVVGANIVLRQAYYYMTIRATARQTNSVRLRVFGHLLRRQIYDDEPLHSGDVTSRLETDVTTISDAITATLPQLIVTVIKLVGAFLMLYSMDSHLAWMLLLSTPFLAVLGKLFARRLRDMTHDVRQQDARIQMLVQEGMEHNAMLRAMESGQWLTSQLDDMQQGLFSKIERRTRFTLAARSFMAVCFGYGYLLAFVWGGLQLRDGAITFGVMTAFLQLVAQVQHPILDLLNMVPQLIHASASIDRLEELEGKSAESADAAGRIIEGSLGVSLDDVSFSYAKGKAEVLSHLSHNFAPGSRTALMGLTGAGKTTIFRLMLSLIRPTGGSLSLYTSDARYPIDATLRTNFVFVPQGNTLMSGTIRYNLLLANPKATEQEMWRVLHIAAADFVSELPKGLDSECGERGVGFSEGQAQRIAIARGLLRPGSILLLDEISASLDEETERLLFSRLFEAYSNKTVIMITHRSSVAQLCQETLRLG